MAFIAVCLSGNDGSYEAAPAENFNFQYNAGIEATVDYLHCIDFGRLPDADRLVKEHKRHIITDTGGLPVGTVVHAADIRDRDGRPAKDFGKTIEGAEIWLRIASIPLITCGIARA